MISYDNKWWWYYNNNYNNTTTTTRRGKKVVIEEKPPLPNSTVFEICSCSSHRRRRRFLVLVVVMCDEICLTFVFINLTHTLSCFWPIKFVLTIYVCGYFSVCFGFPDRIGSKLKRERRERGYILLILI